MSTLKQHYWILERAHLEVMRGSWKDNQQYCSKQGTLVEFGERPLGKGGRADKNEFYRKIKEGLTRKELMEYDFAAYTRFRRGLDDYEAFNPPVRTEKVEVILFFGEPGCGKTELAESQFTPSYRVPIGEKFWLTPWAIGKKHIIIDDFKRNLRLTDLLQLLDNYVLEVERKGAHIWWCPETIIITTNVDPYLWYKYNDREYEREALFRRFTACYRFWKNAEKVPRPIEIDIDKPRHFARDYLPGEPERPVGPIYRWDVRRNAFVESSQ